MIAGIPGTGLLEVHHRNRNTSVSYLPVSMITGVTEERAQLRLRASIAGQTRETVLSLPYEDLTTQVAQALAEPLNPLQLNAPPYSERHEDFITAVPGPLGYE